MLVKWKSTVFTICAISLQSFEASRTTSHIDEYMRAKELRLDNKIGQDEVSNEICETPVCMDAAKKILENMDTSVKPCDDFYRFACGQFVKNVHIPDDEFQVNMFTDISEKVQYQLLASIIDRIEDTDPRTFKLLKSYFKICMNTDEINKIENEEYFATIQKLGNWPVLLGDSWKENNFDWMKAIHRFRRSGYSFNYLIRTEIIEDPKNKSKRVIMLDTAHLGLLQQYLREGFENKNVKDYYKFMVDFATAFGADSERAQKELKQSLKFEIALANISLPHFRRNDRMSIKEVQSKYPSIPWKYYLNEILKPHTTIQEDEELIITVPQFLSELEPLLQRTPKRVLANYLMWRISKDSAGFLGEKVQAITSQYEATFTEQKVKKGQWKKCISSITTNLQIGTSALYVRKYYNKEVKRNVEEMVAYLRQSFKKILNETDWLDKKTRSAALEKVDRMDQVIAYPNEFFDDKKLDEYYHGFDVVDNNYFQTRLKLQLFIMEYSLSQLRKPVNETDWTDRSEMAIVNAFYFSSKNRIEIPAGILQGVFFNKDKPKYLNYGGIGSIIGHEITHGFDNVGIQFDKDGNLVDWWEKETKEMYLQRVKCIIDQYSNYTVEEIGLNLNGIYTQRDDIADNGGIKESYFAYKEWEKNNGVEPRLPGLLQYTSHQMFWINAANVYCSKFHPEALTSFISSDDHSPGEFRVIGSMSNNPAFSKDFNCPLGSKMNPVKKCTVW